ncbi:MAG TPA: DUF2321 domain-containing protein, partial [Bacteroidia bacterium]|nr:DUF2321 domain-containing protein [Bacteroidia bacterium]
MLKTTIFISTLLTVSLTVYSQDLKLKCGDKEIDCLNGNKSHFEMVVHCPYHYQNIVSFGIGYDAPKFCDNCGNRYPWTETQLQVTRELIELAD